MAKEFPFRRRRPKPWTPSPAKPRLRRYRSYRWRWRAFALPWLVVATVASAAGVYFVSEPGEILPGWNSDSSAGTIIGHASVIDGDTLRIHGQRIRLHGIDAPERNQTCTTAGRPYRCGRQAASALSERIGPHPVSCVPQTRDRYGRVVAVCYAGGEDLNGWMVLKGWALAYTQYSYSYLWQEWTARLAGHGMWQGDFAAPSEWRRSKR